MGFLDNENDYSPLDKYLAHAGAAPSSMSLPETVIRGAVATFADVGTTYWNSLTPTKYNVETADLLGRIDQDALQVYNEHPDAVKTASFITGLVAPIGLSIKGMSMLRSGAKGYSWFSEAGQAAQLSKVEAAYANSKGVVDASFVKARWELYRGIAYNAVADNVAAEIAIVGTMSAHPYMEDYYKDFGSNFLKSVAFGTGIQTGLGTIISKAQIASKLGAIEVEGQQILKDKLWDPLAKGVSERSHLGELVAIKAQGLQNLKDIVAKATDVADPFTLRPFTIARLERTILEEEGSLFGALKEAAQGELKQFLDKAPEPTTRMFLDFVSRTENAGLDKIDFATVKGATTKLAPTGGENQLKASRNLWETVVQKIKGTDETVEKNVKTDAIYLPWANGREGAYISRGDAPYYLTAADLGKTVESLEKTFDKRWGHLPNSDWAYEIGSAHTAHLDGEFAQAVLWAETLDAAAFNKVVVAPDHLPLLKALHIRAVKLLESDPGLQLSIKITKERPSFEAVTRQAIARKGGVAPDYLDQMRAMLKDWDSYSLFHPKHGKQASLDSDVHSALSVWIAGDSRFLRRGAAYLKKNLPAIDDLSPEKLQLAKDAESVLNRLYMHPKSVALRASFDRIKDADGFVWLYRGLRNEPDSHKALESYSIIPQKAAEFGKAYTRAVKMYRIHVDDIVSTMHDIGPTQNKLPEILAYPPTRDWAQVYKHKLNELPDELLIQEPKFQTVGVGAAAVPTYVSSLDELEGVLKTAQLQAINDLRAKNYGVETIALKTGTPVETIERIIETGQVEGAGLIKYASKLDVEQALNVENRALALSADMNRVLQPAIYAKLNAMNLDETSKGVLEFYLRSSTSDFVRQFGEVLLSDDIKILTKSLYDDLPNVAGAKLKSSLFASTNQVVEALGPTGAVINTIGKETVNIKNAMAEIFEKPISNLMGQIIKEGESVLIEANTAINVNASIQGRRVYKAGSFWIPAEKATLADVRAWIRMPEEEFLQMIEATPEIATRAVLNGREFNIASASVKELFEKLQGYGREMYEFKNVYNKAIGRQELSDIGMWAPSFNPRNKSIAYVHDLVHDTTSMLYADSDELLATGLKNFEDALFKKHGSSWKKQFSVVTKAEQEAYNSIAGRHDSLFMQAADLTKQHGGSSTATVVSTDTSVFKDLLQGYQEHVHSGIEKIMELQLHTTMDALKNLSDVSQGIYSEATKGTLAKLSSKPVDVGQTIRKILLGRPLLSEHKTWGELQQRGQVYTDIALKTITEIFEPILAPLTKATAKVRTPEEWTKVITDMESKGIVNPFDDLDKAFGLQRYLSEGSTGNQALTPRAVALGNGLAATVLLRFAELAQPLVNALSLPILTSAAVNRKMAGAYMGAALDPTAKFSVPAAMYEGIRLLNHPIEGKKISKIGEAKGLFNIELRNVTELLEHQRSLDPGILTAVEKGLEGSMVRIMSKPADLSESIVRRTAFATGWAMAKRAYPTLGDTGKYVFARNFMDEAIGNYTAAQRPAMFQGTFGVAMGLFQTYMLTMAQAMYRQVQHKDWASLGKMLLSQGTIFGASSLPGFHIVSEQIAKSFSDNNFDLETGTLRAVGDPVASMILYGLPSSIGPGVTTRGDIQPRIPNPFDVSSLAVVNLTGQAYQTAERLAGAAFQADAGSGKAMLEALSLQSVSRPVARISELLSGQSITSRGDVVARDAEIYTTQGIISRVMATRPLSEIKARQALHLDSVYGQADADKRKSVTFKLKQHIRNNDLTDARMEELAAEYLRTGTTTGWRSAVAEAIKQAGQDGSATTLSKFKQGSPLNTMIEDLEG